MAPPTMFVGLALTAEFGENGAFWICVGVAVVFGLALLTLRTRDRRREEDTRTAPDAPQ